MILELFYLNFFHVFLVKVIKISLIDQNRNMHLLYKKNFLHIEISKEFSKLSYIHLKHFLVAQFKICKFFNEKVWLLTLIKTYYVQKLN